MHFILGLLLILSAASARAEGRFIPVCDRHPAMIEALVGAFYGKVMGCETLSEEQIREIRELRIGTNDFGRDVKDLTGLQSSDFQGLADLKELVIGRLGDVEISIVRDAGMINLEKISIFESNLKVLRKNDLKGFTKLKEFGFTHSKLEIIEAGIFDENPGLEEIWLYETELREVPQGLFARLPNLMTVAIGPNLELLPDGSFTHNSKMVELDLSGSPLNLTRPGALHGVPLNARTFIDFSKTFGVEPTDTEWEGL